MTRDELINRLSDMQDFTIIPAEFYNLVGKSSSRIKSSKKYSAGKDHRFAPLLRYEKNNPFLTYIAFAIVANMSFHFMWQPTRPQLMDMLKIAGYTPSEMQEYIQRDNGLKVKAVPSSGLRPAVLLLTRSLEDALSDKSEWTRRKRKVENPSLLRLQTLTEYMKKTGLLRFYTPPNATGENGLARYESFVLNTARSAVIRQCLLSETDMAYELMETRLEQLNADRDDKISQIAEKETLSAIFAPLAEPSISYAKHISAITDILKCVSTINQNGSRMTKAEREMYANRCRANMPPEALDIIDRTVNASVKIEKSFNGILERHDELQELMISQHKERMQYEDLSIVAEEAFQSIVSGNDEIFKLEIGGFVWIDFIDRSSLPLPTLEAKVLEDEEEWDYISPESNGKLALRVFDTADFMDIRSNNEEANSITVPLSSVLSQYAWRPLEPQLYIRKSHIKVFKEAGYSDRRARDFAVVLGTLASVNTLEGKSHSHEPEELFDVRENTEATKETDISCAGAEKITEMNRILKQEREENQSCRHEISALRRENHLLRQEIEQLKHQFTDQNEAVDEDAEDIEKEIEYPYLTKLKVVVYGGFDVFHKELKKYIPSVRIVEPAAHIDVAPAKNADIVFLQINKTAHSGYWTIRDACKASGVPYIHLNYASAKRCADMMVNEIRKLEQKEQAIEE